MPCAGIAQEAGTEAGTSATTSPDAGGYDPKTILEDPGTTQAAAETAAIRLLSQRDDTTKAAVINILRNGSASAKVGMARGLSEVRWADDSFIDPLMALLSSHDVASAGAAAQALSQYHDNPQVLQELANQARTERSDIRPVVIPALGAFAKPYAAEKLIEMVDEPDPIGSTAIDALIEMTGQTDLDHNADKWKQWYAKLQNQNLSDAQFAAEIIRERGEAFESQLADQKTFQGAASDFLRNDLWNAPAEKRGGILLSYLRSPAPEIRELGAELVYEIRTSIGAPPGTIEEARLLISDPSPDVRAATARALDGDADSTPQLVAQLARETDDEVRVQLITTLGPFDDPDAIREMLKLVGSESSSAVRIAAAQGLSQGGDVINKDPQLKKEATTTLKAALDGTELPGEQNLRAAIVGALAVIKDDSLSDTFHKLLTPTEDVKVRAKALEGLGNLPGSTMFAHEIAEHLQDPEPEMRLAALRALRNSPPNIDSLLRLMNEDPSDEVKREAWADLQAWAQMPDADEAEMITLANGLNGDPTKELAIRRQICVRLKQDGNKPKDLAEQQQDMGDLMSGPTIDNPTGAADQYTAALDYWRANNGSPDVIKLLCRQIVDCRLAAKQWDEAANFAAGIIKQYGNNVATQTVAEEFMSTANTLDESSDPNAFSDAMAMMDAVQKMNPPLPADYADELQNRRQAMQAKHSAASRPGT